MKTIFSNSTELLSDTISPVQAYLNLRDQYVSVSLFESSEYRSNNNSRSFIGVNPLVTLSINNGYTEIYEKLVRLKRKPSGAEEEIKETFDKYAFKAKHLNMYNGFFGYCAYDAVSGFESIRFKEKTKYMDVPDVCFSIYEYVLVFDNFKHQVLIIRNSFSDESFDFKPVINAIGKSSNYNNVFRTIGEEQINQSNEEFIECVKTGKQHVQRGDVFQLVLSRCFSQDFIGDEFQVYRQLRAFNPSPYMFYFDMGKARVFGTSPEAQIRITNGTAEIHPIAGTVSRGNNDDQQILKLKSDPKENAEHVMLVDLARNDLNKTCKDVVVENFKTIQHFSHVIHMVSKVTGKLSKEEALKTFTGTFPAGTLSGAPKYKAMELIDRYEPHNRGFYGGAIGHITPDGDINMAIIIRSALSYKNKLHYQAGAGIVLDSLPEKELEEVNHKIKAVKQAILKASN